MKMRLLDLFSGIGGFSLGLERSGHFKTVQFCEIDPYCRRVLAKHWPKVPCHDDVRTLDISRIDGRIDAICGGFPCQDISVAGKGEGIDGARSGLWREIPRLARELRPLYIILENVPALTSRGLGTVLGDLAAIGYDAEWHGIPAIAVGARHIRWRIWIVAYPNADEIGRNGRAGIVGKNGRQQSANSCGGKEIGIVVPNANGEQYEIGSHAVGREGSEKLPAAYADGIRQKTERNGRSYGEPDSQGEANRIGGARSVFSDANCSGCLEQWWTVAIRKELAALERGSGWPAEPDVGRVAYGIPSRVDRLSGLGNAVVPQIPELIGRAIGERETSIRAAK